MTTKKIPPDILAEYIRFITHFGVDVDGEFIELNSGGNSCICSIDSEWSKMFGGYSINSVAKAVAVELGKPTKYISDFGDEDDY